MMAGERTIAIRFTGDTKGIERTSRTVQREVSGWREKFAAFGERAQLAAVAVGGGLALMAKDAFTTSKRLGDMDAKARAVFGDQLPKIQAWAEANKRAFGTSRNEVVGLASNMADLLKPMGFTTQQATSMSTRMLDLAGALSKWSGGTKSAAEVSEILTDAMLGERDSLKSLGISISEADVQARLAKKGQEKLTGAALQQASAIATQELILEKSTDAQAAWAKGGKAAAAQQNAVATSVQEMREKLATVLAPAFAQVIAVASTFAGWLERNKTTALILAGVVGGLAVAVLTVNAAVAVWSATTRAFTAVQAVLNAVLAANPIGLVVLAIAALVAAFVIAYKKSATFRDLVNRAFSAVKATAQAVAGFFTRTLPTMFGGIMRAASRAGVWIVGRFSAMLGWLRGLPARVGTATVGLFNRARDLATDAARWITGRFDGVVAFFRGMPKRIGGAVTGMWDGLKTAFQAAVNWIIGKWNNLRLRIGGQEVNLPFGKSFSIPSITLHTPDIPYLARGGRARAGRSYLVGERGPELFTPGATGFVTPNNRLGGDGVQVTVLLDGRAIEPRMVKVIAEHDRALRRAVTAGSGR